MLPRVSLVDGEKAKFLLLSTSDYISQMLFTQGLWEDYLLSISKMFYDTVESPLVLDIGANLGAYSIPIAKDIQNRNGTVIGFEAQRIVYYQLCGNVFVNRLDNYFAYNNVVTDSDGVFKVPEVDYKNNNNIGAFSLEKKYSELNGSGSFFKESFSDVQKVKLDNFEVSKSPSIIKIDVEGHELAILRGANKFLEEYSYPPILFEAWSETWFSEGKVELMKYFKFLGYEVTNFNTTDFIAQHPKNSVKVDFLLENQTIHMNRVK